MPRADDQWVLTLGSLVSAADLWMGQLVHLLIISCMAAGLVRLIAPGLIP